MTQWIVYGPTDTSGKYTYLGTVTAKDLTLRDGTHVPDRGAAMEQARRQFGNQVVTVDLA